MAEVCLGIGSNLGDKAANFQEAAKALQQHGQIIAVSSLYRTEPVGFAEQDWFLNAALRFRTDLEPRDLLRRLLEIEEGMGRIRTIRNGPRLIDLDILLWDQLVLDEPGLSIPHPRLHERLFVLAPLAEIAPAWRHPLLSESIESLHTKLEGSSGVERLGQPFPAFAGFPAGR